MAGPQSVQLAVGMPAECAWELAQPNRRATFRTYLTLIEAHLPHEARKRGACLMIAGREAGKISLGKIGLDRTAHMG